MESPPLREVRRKSLTFLPLLAASLAIAALFVLDIVAPQTLGGLIGGIGSFKAGQALLVVIAFCGISLAVVLTSPTLRAHAKLILGSFRRKLHFDTKAARDLRARLLDFENASDLTSLARVYLDADRVREALPLLARSYELEPENARTAWLFGRALTRVGQPQQAALALDAALAKDPEIGFGEALLERARLAVRLDDAASAKARAEEHARRNGPMLENLWLQAEAARIDDRPDDRMRILQQAHELAIPTPSPTEVLCRARIEKTLRSGGRS